jgi:hypothetical protein
LFEWLKIMIFSSTKKCYAEWPTKVPFRCNKPCVNWSTSIYFRYQHRHSFTSLEDCTFGQPQRESVVVAGLSIYFWEATLEK